MTDNYLVDILENEIESLALIDLMPENFKHSKKEIFAAFNSASITYLNNYEKYRNTPKETIFYKFLIKVLGPIVKIDPFFIFQNEVLVELSQKPSVYNRYLLGFTGIDLHNLVMMGRKYILEHNVDDSFLINFSKVSLSEGSLFRRDSDNLADDYFLYTRSLKASFEADFGLFLGIICHMSAKEYATNVVFSIKKLREKTNGNYEHINGVHYINISSSLVESYMMNPNKELLAKILIVLFHEIGHLKQYEDFANSKFCKYSLCYAKEDLMASEIRYFYDDNYSLYNSENMATKEGIIKTKEFMNDFFDDYSLDESLLSSASLFDFDPLFVYREYDNSFHSTNLNKLTSKLVLKRRNLLDSYPVLKFEYNKNGSHKSLLEKATDYYLHLENLNNEKKELVSAHKSGLISYDVFVLEVDKLESKFSSLDDLYVYLVTNLIDVSFDCFFEQLKELTSSSIDINFFVDAILNNINNYGFSSFEIYLLFEVIKTYYSRLKIKKIRF